MCCDDVARCPLAKVDAAEITPVPLAPSLLRVSFTSGMVGSSMPLINSMLLAMQTICGRATRLAAAWRTAGRARVNAAALGAAARTAREKCMWMGRVVLWASE
jgi:hypothetical protein